MYTPWKAYIESTIQIPPSQSQALGNFVKLAVVKRSADIRDVVGLLSHYGGIQENVPQGGHVLDYHLLTTQVSQPETDQTHASDIPSEAGV